MPLDDRSCATCPPGSRDFPEAVRGALQVTLADASPDASPEEVLADTFARLGYLPDEAKQAARKLLPR